MTKTLEKISIITVVFNGKDFIENTIKSVIDQTYPNIEYIVIDGNSTDGTVDILKKYDDRITYWVSEPDKGIYDAMNKAIDKATGRWINFMNAGDFFYSDHVLHQIFSVDTELDQYATVYGDAEFRLKNIAYVIEAADIADSNNFMPFSHQAAFVRSDVAKHYKFDLNYRITADSAFFLRLIREGLHFKHIPVTVCSYDALVGLSVQNELKRSKELVDMQIHLNGADSNSPYFKKYLRNAQLKQRIKKFIPQSLWTMFREKEIKKKYKYKNIND
ncbi:MAG: glycosyltransferase family 2 protein [Dysgonomonas sp.]